MTINIAKIEKLDFLKLSLAALEHEDVKLDAKGCCPYQTNTLKTMIDKTYDRFCEGWTPAGIHHEWYRAKRTAGFCQGRVKDNAKKEHPHYHMYNCLHPDRKKIDDVLYGIFKRGGD